jgi:hypothetical protein
MVRSVFEVARSADDTVVSKWLIQCSIPPGSRTERAYHAEFSCEARALRYCCEKSSSLWCEHCGHNYLWSGADEHVRRQIHDLLWLPPRKAVVPRKRTGALEAGLALLGRVGDGRKPLGQIVLDELNDVEADVIRATLRERVDTLCALEYQCPGTGVHMLGFCMRARRVGDILCLQALAELYARAELPVVAAEIDSWRKIRRSPSAGPDSLVSRWIKRFDPERTGSLWLTGILLGYPVWTTIAMYHDEIEHGDGCTCSMGCGAAAVTGAGGGSLRTNLARYHSDLDMDNLGKGFGDRVSTPTECGDSSTCGTGTGSEDDEEDRVHE